MRHNDGSAVRFLEETIVYSWTGPVIMRHNDGSAVRFLEETIVYSWTGPVIMRHNDGSAVRFLEETIVYSWNETGCCSWGKAVLAEEFRFPRFFFTSMIPFLFQQWHTADAETEVPRLRTKSYLLLKRPTFKPRVEGWWWN